MSQVTGYPFGGVAEFCRWVILKTWGMAIQCLCNAYTFMPLPLTDLNRYLERGNLSQVGLVPSLALYISAGAGQ